jgi:hypothetical protein
LEIDHDNISEDTNPLFEKGLSQRGLKQEDWNVEKESLCNYSQANEIHLLKQWNAGSVFRTISVTRFDNTHFISFA